MIKNMFQLFQVNIQIGFEGAFEYFSQSIGNNIGKVVIERFEGQLFPKLFNGKEFHHLDVSHTIFTQTEALVEIFNAHFFSHFSDKLNNTIRDHSVEQLTLTVGKVVMSDPGWSFRTRTVCMKNLCVHSHSERVRRMKSFAPAFFQNNYFQFASYYSSPIFLAP